MVYEIMLPMKGMDDIINLIWNLQKNVTVVLPTSDSGKFEIFKSLPIPS